MPSRMMIQRLAYPVYQTCHVFVRWGLLPSLVTPLELTPSQILISDSHLRCHFLRHILQLGLGDTDQSCEWLGPSLACACTGAYIHSRVNTQW